MKKKVTIEMLVEGPGGDLVFREIDFETKSAIKKFAKTATNPVVKHNLKKAAKEKKVKL
tara:strand:- start:5319 stop:5495 length:177 start_codon:yes stop_codon:yes gene_type:complete